MRTITVNIKYDVGDKVWIMCENYPVCLKIVKITIQGGTEDEKGATSDFGKVIYYLSHDRYHGFYEEQLCDTFEELRDKVFSDAMRENVEQDEPNEED